MIAAATGTCSFSATSPTTSRTTVPGKRQSLVRRAIGRVENEAELLVRLRGEEAVATVVRPLELEGLIAADSVSPPQALEPVLPVNLQAMLEQHRLVGLRRGGDDLRAVIKDVEVLRNTWPLRRDGRAAGVR